MKDLRQDYRKFTLDEADVPAEPMALFKQWFDEALESDVIEPNAMILSTQMGEGTNSRTVLLKGIQDNQFTFFTNYESQKAQELDQCSQCSLLFLWLSMERQVKVIGKATKMSAEHSDQYYNSRPLESRLGAWVSQQSKPIGSRQELEEKVKLITQKFSNQPLTRPPYWGGYQVLPLEIEFWQGRPSRLHDRIVYQNKHGAWQVFRKQP